MIGRAIRAVSAMSGPCSGSDGRGLKDIMKKFWRILTVLVLLAMGAGFFLLMTMDIPAPGERVERTLSNDDFPN